MIRFNYQWIPLVFGCLTGAFAGSMTQDANGETFTTFTEPIQTIHLSAAVPGRIAEVLVKRGDRIHAESMVMRLESGVLHASRLIAQQEATSNTAIESLEVELEIKNHRFKRIAELLKKGAVSPEESKRAAADAKIASLSLQASLEKQTLAELKIDEIDSQIEQRCVRGQVDGLVTHVLREPGEYVSTSDPHVATVVVLDQLRCTFFVSSEFADSYEAGDTLDVTMQTGKLSPTVKGLQTSKSHPTNQVILRGAIEYIAEVTQADSGRVRFDVLIDNPHQHLRSGLRCWIQSPTQSVSTAGQQGTRRTVR